MASDMLIRNNSLIVTMYCHLVLAKGQWGSGWEGNGRLHCLQPALAAATVLACIECGWPLVWKTWKCQGIIQMSGKCQEFTKSHGIVRKKILSWKIALKLHNCINNYKLLTSVDTIKDAMLDPLTKAKLACFLSIAQLLEWCLTAFQGSASMAVDGTGFYDVVILKSLSLNMNLTVWSLTLTPVVQAWYEYQLKWSGVLRIIRELSRNFIVSGEWSPCECGTTFHDDDDANGGSVV